MRAGRCDIKTKKEEIMKKRIFAIPALVLVFLFVTAGVFAADGANRNTKKPAYTQLDKNMQSIQPQGKATQISGMGWALIGLDVLGAGLSVYALLDEISAADAYDLLYADLNNTTQANYDMLAAKKKDIDSKLTFVSVTMGLTGAFVVYTLVDLLWLHLAFPDAPKMTYNGDTKTYIVSIERRF